MYCVWSTAFFARVSVLPPQAYQAVAWHCICMLLHLLASNLASRCAQDIWKISLLGRDKQLVLLVCLLNSNTLYISFVNLNDRFIETPE